MSNLESHDEDRAKILAAFGGKKGLLDSGAPALIFLVAFNFNKDVRDSAYLALGFSMIVTIIRLVKRDTIQHALSGVIGIAFCAWLSNRSGKAEDFDSSMRGFESLIPNHFLTCPFFLIQ